MTTTQIPFKPWRVFEPDGTMSELFDMVTAYGCAGDGDAIWHWESGGWVQYGPDLKPMPSPACPPSAVHDMIVTFTEVREGDLILWDGEFRLAERIWVMDHGNPAIVLDGGSIGGIIPCGTYAAVRRYDVSEG
jgi:hypothetical protein